MLFRLVTIIYFTVLGKSLTHTSLFSTKYSISILLLNFSASHPPPLPPSLPRFGPCEHGNTRGSFALPGNYGKNAIGLRNTINILFVSLILAHARMTASPPKLSYAQKQFRKIRSTFSTLRTNLMTSS